MTMHTHTRMQARRLRYNPALSRHPCGSRRDPPLPPRKRGGPCLVFGAVSGGGVRMCRGLRVCPRAAGKLRPRRFRPFRAGPRVNPLGSCFRRNDGGGVSASLAHAALSQKALFLTGSPGPAGPPQAETEDRKAGCCASPPVSGLMAVSRDHVRGREQIS